jgi:hypothetical protein
MLRGICTLVSLAAHLAVVMPALAQEITRSEAIMIALAEAHRLHVVLEEVYWAIYITPNPPPGVGTNMGPHIVVFVETASRAVLGHLRP